MKGERDYPRQRYAPPLAFMANHSMSRVNLEVTQMVLYVESDRWGRRGRTSGVFDEACRRCLLAAFILFISLFTTICAYAELSKDLRGSSLTYRNVVSANTLDRAAEPTYNPFHQMQLTLAPRYWVSPNTFFNTSLSIAHELTEADDTTYREETRLSDWRLGVGARIHSWDFGLTTFAGVNLTLPTSLASEARTMIIGGSTAVTLVQALKRWGSISYTFGVGYTAFEYTTGALETPRISDCGGEAARCDPFLNTGIRNAPWSASHSANISIFPLKWLFISTSMTWIMSYLYPRKIDDSAVSYVPQEPSQKRGLMAYNIELDLQPSSWLIVALMANTFNPQLAPNSTRYPPFYNRFTTFMVDLRFTLGVFRAAQSDDAEDYK